MLKILGQQAKGLKSYLPSKFENDSTPGKLKYGLTGSSGAVDGQ